MVVVCSRYLCILYMNSIYNIYIHFVVALFTLTTILLLLLFQRTDLSVFLACSVLSLCSICTRHCMSATMCMTQKPNIVCYRFVLCFPLCSLSLSVYAHSLSRPLYAAVFNFYHFTFCHFNRDSCVSVWLYLPSAPKIVPFLCIISVAIRLLFLFFPCSSPFIVCLASLKSVRVVLVFVRIMILQLPCSISS